MARIVPKNWAEFSTTRIAIRAGSSCTKSFWTTTISHCLPVASKALAPMLWLIASDTKEGIIDAEPKKLGYRLRMTPKEVTDALNPLIEGDFFSVVQDADDPLAQAEHSASLEEENKLREEKEEKKRASARLFDDFWKVCPKKIAPPKARAAFFKAIATTPPSVLVEAMQRYAAAQVGQDPKFILHPTTWLNQQRWLDDGIAPKAKADPAQLREQRERAARLGLPTDRIDRAIEEAKRERHERECFTFDTFFNVKDCWPDRSSQSRRPEERVSWRNALLVLPVGS